MKTSQVFRAAKETLPKNFYICWAIGAVSGPAKAKERAKKIITKRLAGSASLGLWLQSQGVPLRDIKPKYMRVHRHAWLDRLIAEFEAKGD